MRRVCAFTGSSAGKRPQYAEAVAAFGRALAERSLGLVYGGAGVGLMGTLADAALAAGAEVIGVLPRHLQTREIEHRGLTELRVVGSMHERKATMAALSDAFVALPGGLGTFEELFEIWTWAQLGLHDSPCGLLNTDGYYDGMIAFLDHATAEGFIGPAQRAMLQVETDPNRLLDLLESYRAPSARGWRGSEDSR